VSVAASRKKGKSICVEYALRLHRQRSGALMAFEVPKQQQEKDHNAEHEPAKVMAGGSGAAGWQMLNHK
jgi:hypothetical protein